MWSLSRWTIVSRGDGRVDDVVELMLCPHRRAQEAEEYPEGGRIARSARMLGSAAQDVATTSGGGPRLASLADSHVTVGDLRPR